MKGSFNLSEWALKHQSFVWYLMFVSLLMGVFSYLNLGREEDPSFTIKTMVIQTRWPGANQEETLKQVTDRIEKKLEELDSLDYVKSYTRPGESTVYVYLRDTTKAKDIPEIWYQVRKKIGDIRYSLSPGHPGPVVQRRVRRRVRLDLRLYRRRPVAAPVARLRRAGARRYPRCAGPGQDRDGRPAGRSALPEFLDPQTGGAGYRSNPRWCRACRPRTP